MTRRLIVRPEAEADITDAAIWYESRIWSLNLPQKSELQFRKHKPSLMRFPVFVRNLKFAACSPDDFPIAFSLLIELMVWLCSQ